MPLRILAQLVRMFSQGAGLWLGALLVSISLRYSVARIYPSAADLDPAILAEAASYSYNSIRAPNRVVNYSRPQPAAHNSTEVSLEVIPKNTSVPTLAGLFCRACKRANCSQPFLRENH